MKLIPRNVRVNTEDPLGHGMEAGVVILLFVGGGYWLDKTVGTTPVFTIGFMLLGAVGLFAKLKYSYDARMDELQGRRAKVSPNSSKTDRVA